MHVAMISAAASCADVRTIAATVRLSMPRFDICANIVLVITFYPPLFSVCYPYIEHLNL
jgi:hypothetical protein